MCYIGSSSDNTPHLAVQGIDHTLSHLTVECQYSRRTISKGPSMSEISSRVRAIAGADRKPYIWVRSINDVRDPADGRTDAAPDQTGSHTYMDLHETVSQQGVYMYVYMCICVYKCVYVCIHVARDSQSTRSRRQRLPRPAPHRPGPPKSP